MANAIAYLVSPLSGASMGTVLAVDGGMRDLRLRPAEQKRSYRTAQHREVRLARSRLKVVFVDEHDQAVHTGSDPAEAHDGGSLLRGDLVHELVEVAEHR